MRALTHNLFDITINQFSKSITNGLIFLILLVGPLDLRGQSKFNDGFVIMHNKDTIYGQVDFRGNYQDYVMCRFKASANDPIKEFFPKDIVGYRIFGVKYFVSKVILVNDEKKEVFLEYLLDGVVDLYFYQNSLNDQGFYLEQNGKIIELKDEIVTRVISDKKYNIHNNEFRDQLTSVFFDQPRLFYKIDRLSFTKKSLIGITAEYHALCVDYACIEYQAITKPIRVKFSPTLGFSFINGETLRESNQVTSIGSINYFWNSISNKGSSQNLIGGLKIDFYNLVDLLGERFSIEVDVFYGVRKYDFLREYYLTERSIKDIFKDNLHIRDELISVNQSLLKSAVLLKYTYPAKWIKPNLGFGFRYNLELNTELNSRIVKLYEPTVDYPTDKPIDYKVPFAFLINFGAEIGNDRHPLGLNIRAERYKSFQKDFQFFDITFLVSYQL